MAIKRGGRLGRRPTTFADALLGVFAIFAIAVLCNPIAWLAIVIIALVIAS